MFSSAFSASPRVTIVYDTFCKLLSKGKKMKGLRQPKERDDNPEGLSSAPAHSILLITTKKDAMNTTAVTDAEIAEMLQALMNEGMQGFPAVAARMYNLAMQFERELHLGAGRYERTEGRTGYANGYISRRRVLRRGVAETAGKWYTQGKTRKERWQQWN